MAIDYPIIAPELRGEACSTSERRLKSNTYYLSINAAILGVAGQAFGNSSNANKNSLFLSVAGAFSSVAWLMAIRSYRRINAAKFEAIMKLEERLPVAPFHIEWDALNIRQKPIKNMI